MRRTGLVSVAAVVMVMAISNCSKTESRKPPLSDQPAGRPPAVGTGGAGATLSDDEFVRDIALKNMAEVELSRMALDKATDPEIKALAQRLIDDHGAAGRKLQSVVSGQSAEWPAQLDDKHRKEAAELAGKQGATFDRDYLEAVIEGHQDLAAKLESRLDVQSVADWKTAAAARTESKALPEPTLAMRDVQVRPHTGGSELTTKINQWAAEMYPVAQKHLDTARTLEKATKNRSNN